MPPGLPGDRRSPLGEARFLNRCRQPDRWLLRSERPGSAGDLVAGPLERLSPPGNWQSQSGATSI